MERKNEIRRLWHDCFPEVDEAWFDMFFSRVYRDEDVRVVTEASDRIVSALLLQPREMTFHGTTVPVSYLSFASTAPRFRGMGSMRHLLRDTLVEAAERGDMAVWLIPARDWLRDYYERAGGWATVVYTHEDNYTSVHSFPTHGYAETPIEPGEALYQAFSRYESQASPCVVLHSPADFAAVVADCRLDRGDVVAVSNPHEPGGEIAAVAVAVPDEFYRKVTVKMVGGRDEQAVEAVLAAVMRRFPHKRVTVITPAGDDNTGGRRRRLTPGGMVRITDAHRCLDIIARTAPRGWRKVVKVRDSIIPSNNHTFLLQGGRGCLIDDTLKPSSLEGFDVDISVLARMVFGSRPIGDLIGFPSVRPTLTLMLE